MAKHTKTPKLIAHLAKEGYTHPNIMDEHGMILIATVVNDEWAKILVTACNNHDKLVEAVHIGIAHLQLEQQDTIKQTAIKVMQEALKEAEK